MSYIIYILGLIRCNTEVWGFKNSELLNKERVRMEDGLYKAMVAVDLC
jgi:hypothetical protein